MSLQQAYASWLKDSTDRIDYETPFFKLIDKIKSGENFTYLRISDGEYSFFKVGKSWDGAVEDETIKLVKETLYRLIDLKRKEVKDLIIAIQWGTPYDKQYTSIIEKLEHLQKEGFPTPLFSWATVVGKMYTFFKTLKESERPIVLVGPHPLEKIRCFKVTTFIETPNARCWKWQDTIESKIEKEIHTLANPIIIYSCAVSAKLAIPKFYEKYKGLITQIDVGANLGPYVGHISRDWHKAVYHHYLSNACNEIKFFPSKQKNTYPKVEFP